MAQVKLIPLCVAAVMLLSSCTRSPQAKEAKYLQRGEAQLVKKDFNRAALEFQNAIKVMPKDPEAYYQLGLADLGRGNPTNAVAEFRKALSVDPKHSGAQLKLAELMVSSRNEELAKQAADLLHSVLAASPDSTEAINAMAINEWQLGKREDAVKRLADTLQKFPSDLQTAVTLARLKLTQQDLAGAQEVLVQAAQSAPKSVPAALALAEIYVANKQLDKAEGEIRRALRLEPQNAAALIRMASLQMAGHRPQEAEQTFRQISALPDKRYRSGHAVFLYATGQRDAAIAELEKLVKDDPEDRATRSRLIAAYFENNQQQKAVPVLAAALKKNSKDTDALFQQSEVDLKLGKVNEAAQNLKQVISFAPNSAPAHSALAAVYRAQHLPHNEQQELSEALRLAPGFLQARLRLSHSFLDQNTPKAALETLDRAPAAQKHMLPWFAERGWALLLLGNTGELRTQLDQNLRTARPPELVLQDAFLQARERNFAGAQTDCEEVLRTNPEDVRAVRLLVESYVAQKQPDKASKKLSELTAAHPKSAPLHQIEGEWYLITGKLPGARQAFEAAKAADFKFVQADLSLAELDRREKHLDVARQRLDALIAADPRNISALLLSGGLENEAGRSDAAVARYRAALAIDSSNVVALNNLAYVLAPRDPDEALKLAQQAAQMAPESASVADTLGWVYYRKGSYSTAVQYLATAVSKEPTPRRQFHLAMSYLKSGDRDRGSKMLETALQADPALPKEEQGW